MAEEMQKFQTKCLAVLESKRLESFVNDKSLLPVYASSSAKIYPYQIAAARFALRSDYLKGCILCDEASLGKTYEALLVAGQMWYEGKENIIVILPPNLIPQWLNKLKKEFTIPYVFWNNTKTLPEEEGIVITTYDCALKHPNTIKEKDWQLAIFDEADVLSNYEKDTTVILKDAVREAYKLLLTPTPITKDLRDIYGLIHFIDESVLPDIDWFYKRYFRKPENYPELAKWVSQFCFRSLKAQVRDYVNFSRRIPITVDYPLIPEEKQLYDLVEIYLKSENKVAYPTMEEYRLNLMFYKTLSSSTQAFANMLEGAIPKTYGLEKTLLTQIRDLARSININSKTIQLLKILKTVFNHLKSAKVAQKAIIFVDKNTTSLDTICKIFINEGYNTLKYKDNDTIEQFRNDKEVQILIATDEAAKGLDLEFCPIQVNYDSPYNSIIMEQRACRCDRQGQNSDVLIINLLSSQNLADVRILELINKRTLQFIGVFGMSDNILGNFDTKIKEVLKNFRHIDEVKLAFKENLTTHKIENEKLVENNEDILFTTFTKSISDKVALEPKYIEDKIDEINNDLWELVKYYFTEIKPDWYEIDDANKTLELIEGYKRPWLFTYNQRGRMRNYQGYKKYKMGKPSEFSNNIISFTSLFAKGLLSDIDRDCPPEAKIFVDADIEPCEIGYYYTAITSKDVMSQKYYLIGQTISGKILTEQECLNMLKLPVLECVENSTMQKLQYGSILNDFGVGNLDDKISKDEILKDYFRKNEGSLAFEIEKIKLLAGRKKIQLETSLNDIKTEIKELKKQIGTLSGIEELKITKQIKVLQNDLMTREENLFFAQAEIDVETEKEIKELTNKYNFNVLISPHFKLQFYSNMPKEPEPVEEVIEIDDEHIPFMINQQPKTTQKSLIDWKNLK